MISDGSELSSPPASRATSPLTQPDTGTEMEVEEGAGHATIRSNPVPVAAEDDVDMLGGSAAASSASTPTAAEPSLHVPKERVVTMHVVKFTEAKLKGISEIKSSYEIAKKANPRVDLRPKMSLLHKLPWSTPAVTSNATLCEWFSTTPRPKGGESGDAVCFLKFLSYILNS